MITTPARLVFVWLLAAAGILVVVTAVMALRTAARLAGRRDQPAG